MCEYVCVSISCCVPNLICMNSLLKLKLKHDKLILREAKQTKETSLEALDDEFKRKEFGHELRQLTTPVPSKGRNPLMWVHDRDEGDA